MIDVTLAYFIGAITWHLIVFGGFRPRVTIVEVDGISEPYRIRARLGRFGRPRWLREHCNSWYYEETGRKVSDAYWFALSNAIRAVEWREE